MFRVRIRLLALAASAVSVDGGAVWLTVSLPLEYPDVPPIFELDSRGFMSYDKEEALYDTLLLHAQSLLGMPMVSG